MFHSVPGVPRKKMERLDEAVDSWQFTVGSWQIFCLSPMRSGDTKLSVVPGCTKN